MEQKGLVPFSHQCTRLPLHQTPSEETKSKTLWWQATEVWEILPPCLGYQMVHPSSWVTPLCEWSLPYWLVVSPPLMPSQLVLESSTLFDRLLVLVLVPSPFLSLIGVPWLSLPLSAPEPSDHWLFRSVYKFLHSRARGLLCLDPLCVNKHRIPCKRPLPPLYPGSSLIHVLAPAANPTPWCSGSSAASTREFFRELLLGTCCSLGFSKNQDSSNVLPANHLKRLLEYPWRGKGLSRVTGEPPRP